MGVLSTLKSTKNQKHILWVKLVNILMYVYIYGIYFKDKNNFSKYVTWMVMW